SFGYQTNLEKFYKKINNNFPSKYTHRNYEWKKNEKDHLPGWNFLTFDKPIIKNVNAWFTEYEATNKSKKMKSPRHKNAVNSLHGLILTLSRPSRNKLETLLNTKIKDHKLLMDGVSLFIKNGKTDKFESIILNSSNFKK